MMEKKFENQTMENIGARVRECRKNMRFTQKQLASMINRTESSINKYERGVIEIPLEVLHNIAEVLEVDENYLLFGQTASSDNSVAKIAKTEEGAYYITRLLKDSFQKRPAKERKNIVSALQFLQENQDLFLVVTESLDEAIREFPYFEDKTYPVGIITMFSEYLSTLKKFSISDEDAAMLVKLFTRTKEIMDKTEE